MIHDGKPNSLQDSLYLVKIINDIFLYYTIILQYMSSFSVMLFHLQLGSVLISY